MVAVLAAGDDAVCPIVMTGLPPDATLVPVVTDYVIARDQKPSYLGTAVDTVEGFLNCIQNTISAGA